MPNPFGSFGAPLKGSDAVRSAIMRRQAGGATTIPITEQVSGAAPTSPQARGQLPFQAINQPQATPQVMQSLARRAGAGTPARAGTPLTAERGDKEIILRALSNYLQSIGRQEEADLATRLTGAGGVQPLVS